MSTLVNQALKRFAWPRTNAPRRLIEAMEYSLYAGGKRLRPLLALCAAEAVGGRPDDALPAAAALEMIHTYSLIHDDLPAMDDDDLRRGRATCHKAYDEATAILAGDALNTYAFELVLEHVPDPRHAVAVGLELARAAGIDGMVGGQMADVEAEGAAPDLQRLVYIHEHKTGALIAGAVTCGAILGGASPPQLDCLRRYGRGIGLAFQVVDDILDMTATAEQLGKSPGKDAAANKMTYPRVMGIEKARAHAQELIRKALDELAVLPAPHGLRVVAEYFVSRAH
ncbi:MAG: polyprenyl synthetase family protein [Planctomycetes bacterium]|nr:polyprenyl synthetase family protein [Planctomycetota bacterium]